mmetsp:Transcript_8028/g.26388  ORF Transcript_8028/g.26388 Transcript_8028/m.26388 type:complete len:110 (+) Transcript_8028:43-372(+)
MRVVACVSLLAAVATAFQPAPTHRAMRREIRPSIEPLKSILVNLRTSESVDEAIMRLRRAVNKSGHLRTLRTKRYFEDTREKKKRKLAEARKKMKFIRQLKKNQKMREP